MSETMTELSLTLSERHTADFEMIGNGGSAPLSGFRLRRLGARLRRDAHRRRRLLADPDHPGDRPRVRGRRRSRAVSDEGKPLGRITVEEIFERDVKREAEQVYGTTDEAHPGVAAIYEEGNRCIAGPIEVDALPDHEDAFMSRSSTAPETKAEFERRG